MGRGSWFFWLVVAWLTATVLYPVFRWGWWWPW